MILPYDVNAYLSTHSTLTGVLSTYGLSSIQILPLNSEEPCSTTTDDCGNTIQTFGPFITYFWMPGVRSNEAYFLRKDRIRYHVLDRDFDRMWNIAEALVEILDTEIPAGKIPIACSDHKNKIMNYFLTNSKTNAPRESGGLADTMLEFEFLYTRYPMATA